MRPLLLLAFLAFLPPAPAEEFHEPFEADVDNNGIPDFWARLSDPGYLRYNELTFPDPDRPHGGAASVRVRMHGGSAGLRSQCLLAIDPGLVCELSGRVRTAGFDRSGCRRRYTPTGRTPREGREALAYVLARR